MFSKESFISQLKTGQFKDEIFEDYYKEHSDKEWNLQHFQLWISSQSAIGVNIAGSILQSKIIPYYKHKFNLVELKDKEGNLIKYVE